MSTQLAGSQRALFWALIIATLAARLPFAFADHHQLIALDIVQDDAFYYFKIARNLAAGRGMTFDATAPTSGVQPLYMLLLVPVMLVAGDDPVLPMRIAQCLLAAVAVASAALVFGLTRRLAGAPTALVAMALWACAPYFVVFGLNGQETGIAVFFALAVLWFYVRWMKGEEVPQPRQAIAFGAVCTLAVLARVDLVLLLAAVALDWMVTIWRRGRRKADISRAALAASIAFGLWLPWGVLSHSRTGTWLPSSGPAGREIALQFGWANLEPLWAAREGDAVFFETDAPPATYYADVATKQLLVFLFEHPLLAPLRAHIPFDVWPRLDAYAPYRGVRRWPAALPVAAALLVTVLVGLARRPESGSGADRRAHTVRVGGLILGYGGLMFAGYTFYSPTHWFFSRYLIVPVLLSTLASLAAAHRLAAPFIRKRRCGRSLVSAVAAVLVAWQALALGRYAVRDLAAAAAAGGFLQSWRSLQPYLDKSKKIGAFQAGTYGYFSGLDIVNLDGKVNPRASRALRENRLHRFIAEENIAYVLDWEWVLMALCVRHLPPQAVQFQLLARETGPGGASLYAVVPPARSASPINPHY